jgi:ABC-type amino acid transport substrate-binding protein
MNRKNTVQFLSVILLAIAVSWLTVHFTQSSQVSSKIETKNSQQNVKERVLTSGVIRCSYVNNAPGVIKDPNTGVLSGIMVELLEETAKNLGLRVEWTREVGWSSLLQEVLGDHADVSAYVWPNSSRAKQVDFSVPIFYNGIGVWVKDNNHRFDGNLKLLNSKEVRFSATDGSLSMVIPKQVFPNATILSLPEDSSVSQILLDVVNKKADATCVDSYHGLEFLKHNPGSVRNIAANNPIKIFGNAFIFKQNETEFKVMLDTAILELINGGYVDKLIKKYENAPGALYRVAVPYR